MLEERLYQLDIDDTPQLMPEKRLLLTVLERALNDLVVGDREMRKAVFEWLTEWVDGIPNYISFKDVYTIAGLKPAHKIYIANYLQTIRL